ncbi:DUF6273 domain-containing protein [Paenibacillus guangzhouensis]|uniref:DUF6273 domain-containing protein n=1 Tax=Paenibacillus guangzhouensis TaxID=1473112 RepID=UPI00187B946F|nr:DUF6273 domain-containing protein [Paenibacillus guangzhouensis]
MSGRPVLQNSGKELFILSEYIMDCRRYHGEYVDITWRDCDLRKWLNDEIYQAAFNDSEKKIIKSTHCADNGEGSVNTEDKVVSLLSVTEAKELTDQRKKARDNYAPRSNNSSSMIEKAGPPTGLLPQTDGLLYFIFVK